MRPPKPEGDNWEWVFGRLQTPEQTRSYRFGHALGVSAACLAIVALAAVTIALCGFLLAYTVELAARILEAV